MKTVYSPRHHGHSGNVELVAGAIVPAYEMPSRAEFVLSRLNEVKLGPVLEPDDHSLATAAKVHDKAYLDFLPTIYDRWTAEGRTGTALPFTWPTRGLRGDKLPEHIDGQLGFYSFDGGCGHVAGTWDAIKSSHDVALTAAGLVNGRRKRRLRALPPTRPSRRPQFHGRLLLHQQRRRRRPMVPRPGREAASRSSMSITTTATARRKSSTAARTLQVINLHADPMQEYPYFLGSADEIGRRCRRGLQHQLPMRWGTSWETWNAALEDACGKLKNYGPDVVVVSLGVDTYEKDPISKFKLKTEDFPKIGARIAKLGLPTLVVMEGGYAVADIGTNAVACSPASRAAKRLCERLGKSPPGFRPLLHRRLKTGSQAPNSAERFQFIVIFQKDGRVAQRESTSFTPKGSQVRSLSRPHPEPLKSFLFSGFSFSLSFRPELPCPFLAHGTAFLRPAMCSGE